MAHPSGASGGAPATPSRSVVVSIGGMSLRDAIEETKRTLVLRAIEESGGIWAAAARALGMARGNLHHLAQRLGLRK